MLDELEKIRKGYSLAIKWIDKADLKDRDAVYDAIYGGLNAVDRLIEQARENTDE